jgi:hypothetical protein
MPFAGRRVRKIGEPDDVDENCLPFAETIEDAVRLRTLVRAYLIVSQLSALGIMDRIELIRSEWHSRKGNLLLANLLS